MAKITNPSKLLPSAKSTAITKVGKSGLISPININKKSVAIVKSNDVGGKLVNIEKFLKSDLIVSQKKAEVKRKEKEKQDFDAAEKKLETPQSKGLRLPGISAPSLGFLDRVKRFLFFTALGWLLPKILEFLPKLEGFAKIVGGIYKFGEGLFGKLFDGFMSLVKFGGDLKEKTLGFIASAKAGVGGNYQTEFDKLEKQFNTFVNASIIVGVLAADIGGAAVDEYNKWRKKSAPEPQKGKKGGKPKVTEGRGGKKPTGKPKVTTGKGGKVPGWWNNLFKGPFAKLKGPLSKFAGAAVPGLGAAVGAADAAARFKSGDNIGGALASVSAGLDTITAILALTGVGVPAAAIFGGVSIGIDILLLIRDIGKVIKETYAPWLPMFSGGGRVVRRYQGGGTTRGGRPVGGPSRRSITPTRKKPPRVSLPKTQPGKDVGGEKKIKEFYAKPQDESKKYTRPSGGWLSTLFDGEKKDLTAFDTLKKMSGTLKSDETLAKGILGVMSSGIDMALGQKPDKKVFKAFFDSIGYVADTLANQRTNKSMSSLMSQIRGFAEGGTVPSRELRGSYGDMSTGDLLAKLIGPTIDQRVNEAIQSIEKELMLKKDTTKDDMQGPGNGFTGTSGGEYGGYAPSGIQKEIYEYLINEKKMSDAQALGIMANIFRESGFRVDAKQPDGPGIGLFQYSSAGRKEAFLRAVPDWEKNWKAQIDYALKEPGEPGQEYLSKKFSSSEEAADWWMRKWERPAEYIQSSTGPKKHREYLSKVPKAPDGTAKFREGESSSSFTGGVLPSTKLGSKAGDRKHPITGEWKMHSGNDYPMPNGTPITITRDGVVTRSEVNGSMTSGYGNLIEIQHSDGSKSIYAHLSDRKVGVGSKVKAGSVIGTVGSTGGSTGSHLHFEYDDPNGNTVSNWQTLNSKADKTFLFGDNVKPSITYKLAMKGGKEGIIEKGIWKAKKWTPEEKQRYNNTQSQASNSPQKPTQIGGRPSTAEQLRQSGIQVQGKLQGGGLIAPKKPNRTIPNSFASYETPRSNSMLAIQPMIYYLDRPTSSGNSMIAFPVPIPVNSSMPDLSLSRG
jgi:murein DD-endopeptidase MepM/ murein hydrolase activator NlpD